MRGCDGRGLFERFESSPREWTWPTAAHTIVQKLTWGATTTEQVRALEDVDIDKLKLKKTDGRSLRDIGDIDYGAEGES